MDPTEDTAPAEPEPVEYTDAARARIALSAAAAELADRARAVVDTRHDATSEAVTDLLERVNSLGSAVDELRRLAVIYARERAKPWGDIGAALGVTRQTVHARFSEVVDEWEAALYDPARHTNGWLPDGAHNPEKVVPRLDAWLARHQERHEPPYSVSAGLPQYTAQVRVREAISRSRWLSARLVAGDAVSAEVKAEHQRRKDITVTEVTAVNAARRAES